MALALALRLYGNGAQSYWFDEIFSVLQIRRALGDMLGAGFVWETNPPLYYLLLRLWVWPLGDGESATRVLSAILGTLTVPVVVAIGATIATRRAGLYAALLFALAAIQVEYGQETRQYALLVLMLSLALLGLVRAVARRGTDGAPPRSAGLLFVGGMTAAVYSHNAAVIAWLAMTLCLAGHLLAEQGGRLGDPRLRRFIGAWAVGNGITLLLTAPQLYAIVELRGAPTVAWIPPPTPAAVIDVLEALLATNLGGQPAVLVAGLGVALGAIIWAAAEQRRRPLVLTFGAALPAVGLALLLAISLVRPILLARTALWIPVPLYLLIGSALADIRRPGLRTAAVGAAVAFAGLTLLAYERYFEKEQWRELVGIIAHQGGPRDLIAVTSTWGGNPLLYYWPGRFDPDRCRYLGPPDPPTRPPPPHPDLHIYCRPTPLDVFLGEEVAQGRAFWIVAQAGTAEGLRELAQELGKTYTVTGWRWMNSFATILLVRVAPKRG